MSKDELPIHWHEIPDLGNVRLSRRASTLKLLVAGKPIPLSLLRRCGAAFCVTNERGSSVRLRLRAVANRTCPALVVGGETYLFGESVPDESKVLRTVRWLAPALMGPLVLACAFAVGVSPWSETINAIALVLSIGLIAALAPARLYGAYVAPTQTILYYGLYWVSCLGTLGLILNTE